MNKEHKQNRHDIPQIPEVEKTDHYALLSVSDKTGIGDLAQVINRLGYRIISTGGTAKTLESLGIPVVPVQEITGNPESFDGRMKTISFQIEAGILFDRTNPSHMKEADTLRVPQIDIVVCNLYPFAETIAKPGVTMDKAIENIDVGGPTMLRAAAKNHKSVLVITNTSDYPMVAETLLKGEITQEIRQDLASKAFAHLANYDAQIASFLNKKEFPLESPIALIQKDLSIRYGANPDQRGQLYLIPGSESQSPIGKLKQLRGREPSETNITDIDAGQKSVRIFNESAAVIIKHNTPCGIALGETPAEALQRAFDSDPESAFGGVVVLNRPMGMEEALVVESFKKAGRGQMDIIAVPEISEEALEFIAKIRKSTGVYTFGNLPKFSPNRQIIKAIDGGFFIQNENNAEDNFSNWKFVTETLPTEKQIKLMQTGWKFASRIKSNTILVVDGDLPMARGIGTGQTSRILATKIALERAGEHTKSGILVSDSFFPFPDSVELAIEAGIAAIVQQGGSVNDQLSIDVANKAEIPMVLTGQRVFWH
jgi:phosphoribosylaminoimidazolecarboxamide formyltransferase / IMP cyclohydrolase